MGGIAEDAAFTLDGELYGTDFFGDIFRTDPVGDGMLIGSTALGPGLLGLVAVPEPERVDGTPLPGRRMPA